jgi:ubiquinone/menaquinone biosynthesis C-methylase UbiE
LTGQKTHNELITDQFTRQAEFFSRMPGHNHEDSIRLMMETAELSRQDTVLDVACGSGIVACAFASLASHVTGIDLTAAMLEQAEALTVARGLSNLTWKQDDTESLPFPDGCFSLVISRYAFHHFQNPQKVLSEMFRVCSPGGRVMITDGAPAPEKAEAYNRFEKLMDPSHHRALTAIEFEKLFDLVGLKNTRRQWYKMEMDLEQQLATSFPSPGDEEKIRYLVNADIGIDNLDLGAYLHEGKVKFAYPVLILVGNKPRQ